VTGYGQPKDREHAVTAGTDEYLVKPFDRDPPGDSGGGAASLARRMT